MLPNPYDIVWMRGREVEGNIHSGKEIHAVFTELRGTVEIHEYSFSLQKTEKDLRKWHVRTLSRAMSLEYSKWEVARVLKVGELVCGTMQPTHSLFSSFLYDVNGYHILYHMPWSPNTVGIFMGKSRIDELPPHFAEVPFHKVLYKDRIYGLQAFNGPYIQPVK